MFEVVPNSHFWTDLDQLISTIESEISKKENKDPNLVFIDHMYGKSFEEYLIIGLKNTKSQGYNIEKEKDNSIERKSASDAKLEILESVIRLTNNSKLKQTNIDFSNDENLETSKITITIE